MAGPTTSEGKLDLPVRLGRYELFAEIASGGVATVYLGRMVGKAGFERTVAVKVLHRHLATDPEFVAMFLDEARLSARIRHPNVVDVYDVDAIDGELIIVMEYVEGAALNWILRLARKEGRKVPTGFVLRVVHDTLLGLHAAHELADVHGQHLGLVHRDVSPANLLVGTDGIARVTDFGIAKAAGRIATTRGQDTVKGKLRYLAPEQMSRAPIDRRVDVFAAGIVLWECLTEKPLFAAETEAETLAMVLQEEIRPPSEVRPGVPKEIDAVCLRALERAPAQRYASAADFAEAIEDAVGTAFFKVRKVGAFVSEVTRESIERGRAAMRASTIPRPASAMGLVPGPVRGPLPSLPAEPSPSLSAPLAPPELTALPAGALDGQASAALASVPPSVPTPASARAPASDAARVSHPALLVDPARISQPVLPDDVARVSHPALPVDPARASQPLLGEPAVSAHPVLLGDPSLPSGASQESTVGLISASTAVVRDSPSVAKRGTTTALVIVAAAAALTLAAAVIVARLAISYAVEPEPAAEPIATGVADDQPAPEATAAPEVAVTAAPSTSATSAPSASTSATAAPSTSATSTPSASASTTAPSPEAQQGSPSVPGPLPRPTGKPGRKTPYIPTDL